MDVHAECFVALLETSNLVRVFSMRWIRYSHSCCCWRKEHWRRRLYLSSQIVSFQFTQRQYLHSNVNNIAANTQQFLVKMLSMLVIMLMLQLMMLMELMLVMEIVHVDVDVDHHLVCVDVVCIADFVDVDVDNTVGVPDVAADVEVNAMKC